MPRVVRLEGIADPLPCQFPGRCPGLFTGAPSGSVISGCCLSVASCTQPREGRFLSPEGAAVNSPGQRPGSRNPTRHAIH